MQCWTDKVRAGEDLNVGEAAAAGEAMLAEASTDAERADFLRALAAKGEKPEEIQGFVNCFLGHAVDPGLDPATLDGPVVDIVGTGGDKLDLFNVSTTAMFVLAGGGARVVKHGNRAVTSRSGASDVLQALGVQVDLPPPRFADCVRETGLGFLFAPVYHPAFKAVAPVRQMLAGEGVRTIFNLLGPLLNPVRPDRQIIGVWDAALGPVFASQMEAMGRKRAWVIHGFTGDGRGMDEFSILGETQVWDWDGERRQEWSVHPLALEMELGDLEDLRGGDAQVNAAIARGVLDGTLRDSRRSMVVLNAAAGFVVAGLAENLTEGLDRARESIDSGEALAKLEALVAFRG